MIFPELKWSSTHKYNLCRFLPEIGTVSTVHASFVALHVKVPQPVMMSTIYLLNCWHAVCVRKNVSLICASMLPNGL